MCGAKPPPPKRGAGANPPRLGCFCAYITHSPHPKTPVSNRAPPSLLGGWKGLSQLFNGLLGDFKGFPTIVLILEHNIKVFVLYRSCFSGLWWQGRISQ